MTDIERLAALLHAARDVDGAWFAEEEDGSPILWTAEAGEVLADLRTAIERYDAQGVRVGDPPPPADDAGGLRAATTAAEPDGSARPEEPHVHWACWNHIDRRWDEVTDEHFREVAARVAAAPAPPSDDAGGLRALAEDVVLQEGTYRRSIRSDGSYYVVEDPALAVVPKTALARLRAALAAQPAPDDTPTIKQAGRDITQLVAENDGLRAAATEACNVYFFTGGGKLGAAMNALADALAAQPAPKEET